MSAGGGRDRDMSSPRRERSGGGGRGEGRARGGDDDSRGNRAGSGGGRFARFERGDLASPRRDLRFDRDEERLPDFEPAGNRRFFDEDE